MDLFIILLFLLPMIAFLYASVGHGGASSYIIILTLMNFAPEEIKPAALVLNIIISFVAFVAYRSASEFPWKILLLLLITSIPASYLGGKITLDEFWYRKMLGLLLILPVLRFSGLITKVNYKEIKPTTVKLLTIGLLLGFVSGIIGIGGGIMLSPLLLILNWTNVKQTAGVSAAFIFCNSIAGLAGSANSLEHLNPELFKLMPLTIAAGIFGAYYGAMKFKTKTLKHILSFVLFLASVKLILG